MAERTIKLLRYATLRECFLKCIGQEDLSDADAKTHFWVGHNGRRGYRIRVDRWLAQNTKVWGWANYRQREIHVYVAPDADVYEVIEVLAHEIGHFQRPRYPFGHDEERKAENYRKVTKTAISMARRLAEGGSNPC